MKILIMCLILLSSVIIPIACGNSNNSPAKPIGSFATVVTGTATTTNTASATPTITPGGPTFTNTATLTNTLTPTNTFAGGFTWTPTNTATSTSTITPTSTITNSPTPALPIPVVKNNYGTTAAPNGLVINGGVLTVAESDSTYGPMVEDFSVQAAGAVSYPPNLTNIVFQGFPTPNSTPPYAPTTVGLAGPQGFANPGGNTGYATILDTNGTSATLYWGSSSSPASGSGYNGWTDYGYGYLWEPYSVTGFNIVGGFNSPKGLSADNSHYTYVADTGNGRVEQFDGIAPLHAWAGNVWTFPNVGGVACTSVTFKTPYAVACDSSTPATVYVGDNGYNPAIIEWFASGGTTITGAIYTVPGSVIHGIAIGPAPNYYIYVADAGNGQVEVYSQVGNLLATIVDPHSSFEAYGSFAPNAIAFDANGYIWVGDANNRCIVSFH